MGRGGQVQHSSVTGSIWLFDDMAEPIAMMITTALPIAPVSERLLRYKYLRFNTVLNTGVSFIASGSGCRRRRDSSFFNSTFGIVNFRVFSEDGRRNMIVAD